MSSIVAPAAESNSSLPPLIQMPSPDKFPCELTRVICSNMDDTWGPVLERLESHPNEASLQGHLFGQTALHAACIRYPPLHAVQALIQCAPAATMLQNRDGETALHIACNCASEEVQLEILHAAPGAVELADKYGDTPLHNAARNGGTLRVLEKMLRAAPAVVSVKNCRGITPFCLLSRSYFEAETMDELEENEEYSSDWEAALLFLNAAAPSPATPLVHAAAMTSACPRHLLLMLLKFYPEQALMYDESGKIPLHYAASTNPIQEPHVWDEHEDGYRDLPPPDDSDMANFNLQRGDLEDYVHLQELVTDDANHSVLLSVVHWNPRAARCADADGRLPLTLALMSNKTWDDGLQHLIWAAPQALETRDPVTRMYPFQLAALYVDDIDTVYRLVRSFPQNLAMGMGAR